MSADKQAFIETAVQEITRNGTYGAHYIRRALHALVDEATERWAPVSENQLVLSVASINHYNCPAVNIAADEPTPDMPLVNVDESHAHYRCPLCGAEVALYINFVHAGVVKS
jgi:hypothetical protein